MSSESGRLTDRGQAFTLEAVLGALIVIAGLVFALQAVTVTPATTGSTAAPVDVSRLDSVLAEAADSGALKRSVLAWNGGFQGASSGEGYFIDGVPNNDFGRALDEAVAPSVTMNVIVHYRTGPDTVKEQRMVYNGIPGEGAARAAATVAVYDGDRLRDSTGAPRTGTDVRSAGLYPGLSDRYPSDLYSVLKVEVIAWEA
ncbi:MAG: hypothetical protein ABEJ26_01255 [Halosimplex sp.]